MMPVNGAAKFTMESVEYSACLDSGAGIPERLLGPPCHRWMVRDHVHSLPGA